MVTNLFFPIYITLGLLMVVLFIPRHHLREYLAYGLLLGGLADFVVVFIFQNLFHVIRFKNAGLFAMLGQNLLSPVSWTLTVMLVLYFMPRHQPLKALYVVVWAAYSVGYGYMVHNAGLFDFVPWWYPFPAYFVFLGWWTLATWVFSRTSDLAKVRARPE